MFEITDELVINLDEISSYKTVVESVTKRDERDISIKDLEGKFVCEIIPYLIVSMANGNEYNVKGLVDIYNFLYHPSQNKRRTWNSLVNKINTMLKGNEYESFFLAEEDFNYLSKSW